MDKREKGTRRRKRKRRVAIVKRGKRRVRRGESDILKREKGIAFDGGVECKRIGESRRKGINIAVNIV